MNIDFKKEYVQAIKKLEPIFLKYEKGSIEILYNDIQIKQQLILIYLETFSEANAKYTQWHKPPTPLFYKFFSHVNSICELFKGTNTYIFTAKTNIRTVDRSGTIIMHRALLETYLTLYNLYFDRVTDDVKNMRQKFYQYRGMKNRSKFEFTDKTAQKLAQEEGIKADELIEQLNNNRNYLQIDKKIREKAENRRSGLLISIFDILKKCDLDEKIFSMTYNLGSDHAHSEYISNTQIMTGIMPDDEWLGHVRMIWLQLSILQASVVRNIKIYVPGSKLVHLNDQYAKVEAELLLMCNFRNDKKAGIVYSE